jgi:hypothetical protein
MATKRKKKVVRRPLKKKKPVKKTALKKAKPRPKVKAKVKIRAKSKIKTKVRARLKEGVIGIVTHYFPHVRAAVVKLKAPITVGDRVKIKGHTTDFTQSLDSIQIDRMPVNTAKKGAEIGLLVNSRVRQHDVVYKL